MLASEELADILDRVEDIIDELGLKSCVDDAGELDSPCVPDSAEALVDRLLSVSHGDTITVTYPDKNARGDSEGSVVKTAEVDMEAPVVTLVRPTDKLFTKEEAITLQADVVDTGAGVERDDIVMIATTGVSLPGSEDQLKSPIVSGFSVTGVPTAGVAEGKHTWAVLVMDKVGNTPDVDIEGTEENEGARGAAAPDSDIKDEVDNPFEFTVDTNAPTLETGKTGISLKNPGITSGDDRESEKPNQRDWVRVEFDLGANGGAALDPSTVGAGDFRVDGATPLDAKVNVAGQDCDDDGKKCKIAKGSAVYLQVGQLDTDERPKVELTGEIMDKSGNLRTGGSVSALVDGLSPVLTVTTSADISDDEITITVSSSERLSGRPMVQLATTEPDDGTLEDLREDGLAVSLVTGATTVWEATEDVTGSQAFKYYVVVTGNDASNNSAKVGDDKPADDIISFQLDSQEPSLKFKDSIGEDLEDSEQEEGAVWIVAEFDEDEHDKDSYRKVTVTALTLTNLDTEEVVADDPVALFGGEMACVDHEVTGKVSLTGTEEGYTAAASDEKDKCAQLTLAIDLTPGMYNIKMTGVDNVGNETTKNVDFEVTEAEPFELELKPGQNFISIPGMPMGDGGNIDTLLADEAISSVSTYDRSRELQGENPWLRSSKDLETGLFSGDITAIEPGKAYFINSAASVTVEIRLQAAGDLPPVIPVRQGYNAIGFWSVAGDESADLDLYLGGIGWTVAYTYDPTPGRGWEVLRKGAEDDDGNLVNEVEAGKGYLVYALYDSVLTP